MTGGLQLNEICLKLRMPGQVKQFPNDPGLADALIFSQQNNTRKEPEHNHLHFI